MENNDYITIHQAKKLKDLGFPQDSKAPFYSDDFTWYTSTTLTNAIKWLTINKNILFEINYTPMKKWIGRVHFGAFSIPVNEWKNYYVNTGKIIYGEKPEEVMSKLIDYALETI